MSTRVSRGRVTRVGAMPAAPASVTRPDADAAERKRLRDRVAQQNLRNKRNRHIQALEQQVKQCQELHRSRSEQNGQNGDDLKTIRDLRAENAALRERQKHLQALFQSFKDVFEPAGAAAAAAAADITVPKIPEVPEAANSQTPKPAQPHSTPPAQPCSPPPPPPQHTAPSPVSSASTTEVVMPASVPPHYNKTGQTMDTLPDYSIWLAGINATGSSTDDESEPEMVHHRNHSHHIQMDNSDINGINNHHHVPPNFTMQPLGVPLPQAPPSLFDAQHSQFTADVTDMWSSRMPAPLQTPMLATAADLDASYSSAVAAYNPFVYTARPPVATATPTTAAGGDLDLWVPDDTSTGSVDEIPVWARIPVRTTGPNDVRRPAWDANMRIIFDSPEVPAPLDILFGSHQNPLASSLQRSIKTYYQGNPERLAIGWLVYHYIKWRTQPSAERYALLPGFLKPIFEQIWVPHPGSIDFIVWERMRSKLLKTYDRYDMAKLIRIYCRCLRLRWRWDEDVLVTNAEGTHVLRPDFVGRFMSASGWGLKPEFITYYPELFDGDEWDQIVYNPGPRQIS